MDVLNCTRVMMDTQSDAGERGGSEPILNAAGAGDCGVALVEG